LVSVRRRGAFERWRVGLEAVAHVVQQAGYRGGPDRGALPLQRHRQLTRTLPGPSQGRHRSAARGGLHQGFKRARISGLCSTTLMRPPPA
jgi:hypothetical protein